MGKEKGKHVWAAVAVGALSLAVVTAAGLQHSSARDGFSSERFDYKELPASQPLEVERTACTGQEWTGTDHNIDIASVNTLPDSANVIPYEKKETAFYGARDYKRDTSAYYQLLTGDGEQWNLTVLDNPQAAEQLGDFESADYQQNDSDGWKQVELPASWTSYGFDYSIYTNSVMPFQEDVEFPLAPTEKNPVGLYRKTFQVKDSMLQENGKVYLTFAGVESAYYVYVNGKEAGYSEDSYNPHSFDITDLLNPKGQDNILAVKVLKFCDGTWLEDQDMIYDGGIFRDVYLTSTTNVHIQDYKLVTELSDDYKSASIQLDVTVENSSTENAAGLAAEVTLYDEDGAVFTEQDFELADVASGAVQSNQLNIDVSEPKLWDADHPNLYTAVISLYDKADKIHYESVSQNVGFRKLTFTSTQVADRVTYEHTTEKYETVKLNGKRLILKGVNRHDTDPETGKYVSREIYEADIKQMKQNNINALRTSHYANDDYLYYLCDKYGLYLMCETNNESHAIQNKEKSLVQLENAAMQRQVTAYQRLKNVTANLIWSIGNESTARKNVGDFANGMFSKMIYYFKDQDPARMVHYEGSCYYTQAAGGVDMLSHMYFPPSDIQSAAKLESHMPYLLCEYDHGMGNAVGNLKEYWDIIRSSDNFLGGFIWDWVDQSRKIPLPEGGWDYYGMQDAHASGLNNLSGYYLGYGGDWGDTKNDGNFCQNGLVSADRDPQPELKEVKYQYQDFWFSCGGEELQGNQLTVKNESSSKDLSEYRLVWELKEDSTVISSGELQESLSAGEQKEVTIPYTLPSEQKAGAEYYLNLSVQTKEDGFIGKAGTEIAYEQFKITAETPSVQRTVSAEGVSVTEKDGGYLVSGKEFQFEVDGTTGNIKNYTYQGKVVLTQGPVPNIDRALVDNDYLTYQDAMNHLSLSGTPTVSQDSYGRYLITVSQKMDIMGGADISAVYTVDGSGAVTVAWNFDFSKISNPEFTKIGTVLTLPEGSESISWYGNGEGESYSDRSSYTRIGEYTSTVNQMYYPFARPQDCGNLTGVKWISVSNPDTGYGVLITGENDVNASALHFTAKMLQEAKHTYDLQPSNETYLTIDALVAGTGNNSCGFPTLKDYVVLKGKCNYTYTILPLNQSANRMEEAKKYKSGVRETSGQTETPQPQNPQQTENPGQQPAEITSVQKVKGVTAKASGKKKLKISWKKQEGVTYRVAYSTSKKKLAKLKNASTKKLSGVKVVTVKKNSVLLKNLKAGKKYYIKVCACKGKKAGAWSSVKAIKIKK